MINQQIMGENMEDISENDPDNHASIVEVGYIGPTTERTTYNDNETDSDQSRHNPAQKRKATVRYGHNI